MECIPLPPPGGGGVRAIVLVFSMLKRKGVGPIGTTEYWGTICFDVFSARGNAPRHRTRAGDVMSIERHDSTGAIITNAPFTYNLYAPGVTGMLQVYRWPAGGRAARSVVAEGGTVTRCASAACGGPGWWTVTAVGTSVFAAVANTNNFITSVFPNDRYVRGPCSGGLPLLPTPVFRAAAGARPSCVCRNIVWRPPNTLSRSPGRTRASTLDSLRWFVWMVLGAVVQR